MNLFYIAEIAIFLPLIGFLAAGFVSINSRFAVKESSRGDFFSQGITCFLMGICLIASLFLFYKIALQFQDVSSLLLPWIKVGQFKLSWGIKLDALSVTMMVVVSLVSLLVHIYSLGYMSQDQSIPRFMSYLSFFTFAMLVLVTSPNLLQLFFGWEGVGFASYLLIGFWYEKESANAASMKAFIINRIGDVGLILGICTLFVICKTLDYEILFQKLSLYANTSISRPTISLFGWDIDALNCAGVFLFMGAMGKSAQFPLHTWLPDAMEGPTPVSALIHAATMVTAGVFLMVRMSPLYELAPIAQELICIVGASTALFAALFATVQNDIKRVIAYSTCSQLGYMFFAIGVSAYGAAVFHLVTHAFFKALLFLGAGSVIHAMSDEQNIQRMGGIWRLIPQTYAMMWVGNLALAGLPFFAGYYSKDAILEAAHLHGTNLGQFAFYIGLSVAILTAFYSWRLLILVFHGSPKGDDRVMARIHESPQSMRIPLYILAIGSIVSGYFGQNLFLNKDFWGKAIIFDSMAMEKSPLFLHVMMSILPFLCASVGIWIAYVFYIQKKEIPYKISSKFRTLYIFLLNKGFVDEFYERFFTNTVLKLGQFFWKKGDMQTIDRLGPNGMMHVAFSISQITKRLQTGYIYHYVFAMLLGLILIMAWILLTI